MQIDLLNEARRQANICNACRYCEGYCAVFPAMHEQRMFSDGDLTQLANLCHNCQGCYHACQYTAPHEFNLNLPAALAVVRNDSWATFSWPQPVARTFQKSGGMISLALVLGFAALFLAIRALENAGSIGFYAALSHVAMVSIFLPAFTLPFISLAIGLRRYWHYVDGEKICLRDITHACSAAAKMTGLAAGHGDGCNFEDEDRFSHARRYAHQMVMYGFLLCFAATVSGTMLHYLLHQPAPYPLFSLPKLLGISGGVLLTLGCIWMFHLKMRSDKTLSDVSAWGGEMGFILLLGFTGFSGLALYAAGEHWLMPPLLALHLGAVLTLFLLTPFTKMAHGFFRLAALIRDAQRLRYQRPLRKHHLDGAAGW